MESFKTTGNIQVAIDSDETRVISFNPKDRLFRNRILQFAQELTSGMSEYQKKLGGMSVAEEKDEFGFPVNAKEILAVERETAQAFRSDFDDVFGNGSADKLFGVGGFDETVLADFLNYVIAKVNVVAQGQVEAKLGTPLKAPRKKA